MTDYHERSSSDGIVNRRKNTGSLDASRLGERKTPLNAASEPAGKELQTNISTFATLHVAIPIFENTRPSLALKT